MWQTLFFVELTVVNVSTRCVDIIASCSNVSSLVVLFGCLYFQKIEAREEKMRIEKQRREDAEARARAEAALLAAAKERALFEEVRICPESWFFAGFLQENLILDEGGPTA